MRARIVAASEMPACRRHVPGLGSESPRRLVNDVVCVVKYPDITPRNCAARIYPKEDNHVICGWVVDGPMSCACCGWSSIWVARNPTRGSAQSVSIRQNRDIIKERASVVCTTSAEHDHPVRERVINSALLNSPCWWTAASAKLCPRGSACYSCGVH